MQSRNKRIIIDFSIPLILLGATTLVFWLVNIDIEYQRLFFDEKSGEFEKDTQPWNAIYRMSTIPPTIVFLVACVVLTAGLLTRRLAKYRRICLFAFLVMLLGPALIINCVLKDYWGRPRPSDIVEFNGTQQYVPPLVPGPYIPHEGRARKLERQEGVLWEFVKQWYPVRGKYGSFPSGHAAMAFYLLVFYFILRDKKYAVFLLIGALAYGFLTGFARNVQGGHFVSDVIWSCGIMYFVCLALYYLLGIDEHPLSEDVKTGIKPFLVYAVAPAMIVVPSYLFLTFDTSPPPEYEWNMDSPEEYGTTNIKGKINNSIFEGHNSEHLIDPYMALKINGDVDIDMDGDKYTILEARIFLGDNIPDGSAFRFYFKSEGKIRSNRFPAVKGWHEYRIDMKQFPEWSGTIEFFRLDFVEGLKFRYEIRVDRLKFVSST